MQRITAILLLLAVAVSASGCIIEPGPGPEHERWCIDHPYRCHR